MARRIDVTEDEEGTWFTVIEPDIYDNPRFDHEKMRVHVENKEQPNRQLYIKTPGGFVLLDWEDAEILAGLVTHGPKKEDKEE